MLNTKLTIATLGGLLFCWMLLSLVSADGAVAGQRDEMEQKLAAAKSKAKRLSKAVESHPFRKCLYEFEASANTLGLCGSAGCSRDTEARTITQRCGKPPRDYLAIFEQHRAADERVSNIKDKIKNSIEIGIGSPELDVIARFGNPDIENRTVTAGGVSKQLVYRYRGIIVYTENGSVVAFQE
jgi:hypothetical protein